jgi:outer membrane biogenesis lipoprotein LolB
MQSEQCRTQNAKAAFVVLRLTFCVFICACAARLPKLPEGAGVSLPDARGVWASAAAPCSELKSLSAEIAVSGRTGRRRLRARVLAGVAAPSSVRLEAVAPFGPPAFILVATPDRSELYLPRDRRILSGSPTADIVEALTGVRLGADDLRALLGGCPVADPQPARARTFGDQWRAIDLQEGAIAYVQRQGGRWRLVAGTRGTLSMHFDRFSGERPQRIRLQTPTSTLTLSLSQVEVNVPLGDEVFRVKVPADADPLTLQELRQAGPLGRIQKSEFRRQEE